MKLPSIAFWREVLAKRASVVAVVSLVLSTAVTNGWVGIDLSNEVVSWINRAFILGAAAVTVLVVRPSVTPLSDPRDKDGNALTVAGPDTVIPVTEVKEKETNDDMPQLPLM